MRSRNPFQVRRGGGAYNDGPIADSLKRRRGGARFLDGTCSSRCPREKLGTRYEWRNRWPVRELCCERNCRCLTLNSRINGWRRRCSIYLAILSMTITWGSDPWDESSATICGDSTRGESGGGSIPVSKSLYLTVNSVKKYVYIDAAMNIT